MVKLEKILKQNKIWIHVEENEYVNFLIWAKENDCLWGNGKIIQPYIDKPEKIVNTVVINKDKTIYHPSGYVNLICLQGLPNYCFKDINNGIIKDMHLEKQKELRQSIKDKQKKTKLEEDSFERYLKNQRRISKRQLKYQKYTKSLPKQFFVKYKNFNELLDLSYLLEKYGYENYYNIELIHFNDSYVLQIDNERMSFSPANTTCCTCAVNESIKLYEYKQFVEVIESVFGDSNEDIVQSKYRPKDN